MKHSHLYFLLLTIASGLWSCQNKSAAIESQNSETSRSFSNCEPISYERTACFGPCPVFEFNWDGIQSASLTIKRPFPSGSLSELGMGTFSASIQPARAEEWCDRIDSAVIAVRYTSLDSLYDNPRVTDLPAIITDLKNHRVYNRMGGPNLTILYDELQLIMEDINWRSRTDN